MSTAVRVSYVFSRRCSAVQQPQYSSILVYLTLRHPRAPVSHPKSNVVWTRARSRACRPRDKSFYAESKGNTYTKYEGLRRKMKIATLAYEEVSWGMLDDWRASNTGAFFGVICRGSAMSWVALWCHCCTFLNFVGRNLGGHWRGCRAVFRRLVLVHTSKKSDGAIPRDVANFFLRVMAYFVLGQIQHEQPAWHNTTRHRRPMTIRRFLKM